MKKIIASAVGLMMFGGVAVTTASAVENEFGGYWRTRMVSMSDFFKPGVEKGDEYFIIDNRTRLYYTAKFNDDFKFVNKFEFNTKWGDDNGGDIGADGTKIWKIKNSYVDFTLGAVRTKLGIHSGTIARGFIFDDDFSGATVTGNFGNVNVTGMYIANEWEDAGEDGDESLAAILVPVKIGDTINLTPYFVYQYRKDGSGIDSFDTDLYWIGADFDMDMGGGSVWGTAIYNSGTAGLTTASGNDDADGQGINFYGEEDISAFLVAGGGSFGVVHGQAFYATGDSSNSASDDGGSFDSDTFVSSSGASYYWAEILGYGTFDLETADGSTADAISNIWAVNVGVTFKPMDKLTLGADLWYVTLAEENAAGDDELGTEIDLKATYNLMDNLNLDVVVAYLAAGDAIDTDDDPIEVGARLSLKF